MASLRHLACRRQIEECTCTWRKAERCELRLYSPALERQVSRSFRADSKRAARKQQAAIEVELAEQADAEAVYRGTFQSLIDAWLAECRRELSPSTMRAYDRHAKRIGSRFGKRPAAELTAADIETWFGELRDDGMKLPTVHAVRRVLSSILRRAHRLEQIDRNPLERVKVTGHRPDEKQPPSMEAFRALADALPDSEWANAVLLIMFTGMRRGEVVGVKWADIDDDTLTVRRAVLDQDGGGVIVRDKTKGKRDRTLPLRGGALVALRRQFGRHPDSEWVFPATDGKGPRRPDWLSLMWGRFRQRVPGMESAGLHDLRHFWVTYMLSLGVPLATVQGWAGHAQQTTTLIYSHTTDAGEIAGLAALDALPTPETP